MFRLLLICCSLLLFAGCDSGGTLSDDDAGPVVSFDRKAMLANWVDNVTIPAYENTIAALRPLLSGLNADADLPTLQASFTTAYLAYQRQSPLIFAEGEAVRLREQLNTYPTDVDEITRGFDSEPNLELPSLTDAQGFPALEYLLYGSEPGREPVATDPRATVYARRLVARMIELQEAALTALENNRDAYVATDGNSATASIDRTVNDYVFHYEKFLRAGKVGIPAGVFSDDPLADRVESRYGNQSLPLFLAALEASRDFFVHQGLGDYVTALEGPAATAPLTAAIASQFKVIETTARALPDDFELQVEGDNSKMLGLYDEMQKLTILLKVDMLQTLSINVDYVDADGD